MPRRTLILLVATVLVVVLSSAASIAYVLRRPAPGKLVDTSSLPEPTVTTDTEPKQPTKAAPKSTEQCWRTYGRTEQRASSITNAGLGKPGRVLWRRPVGSLVELPPSICDGVVYLNTARGITMAINADTGRPIWARKTGTIFDSTPAIGKDLIVIGGVDGKIQALYRSTGRTRWKLQVGRSETSPVIDGDVVFAASHDGRVYAIELATGKVRWAYESAGKINGSPVLWKDRVYVANYAGEVLALREKDGSVVWRRTFVLDPFRTERFYSSTPIVGTYGKRLYAFDTRTGRERWSRSMDGPMSGSALVVDDLVFVSTMKHNRTYGFNVRNGHQVWSHDEGRYVPGIATDVRYYFSLRNTLNAMQGTRKPGARSVPRAVAG
jgi:outer membrane protein assembly factor BamB